MIIKYSKNFTKKLKNLSKDVERLFTVQKKIFKENNFDSRLQIKTVKGTKKPITIYSFGITRQYRVLYYFRDSFNTAIFFSIGHRKDIYR